jgi:hypothetical protein
VRELCPGPKFTVGIALACSRLNIAGCWAVLGPRRYDVIGTLTGLVVKAPTRRKSRLAAGGRLPISPHHRNVDVDRAKGDASRDEFACFERAADPLHRAGINTKLLGDLAHARPSRNRQSLPDPRFQLGSYPRPSKPFPLTLGPR